MPTNYQRGYQLEYKAKKILEENGFTATRTPASHTAIDIYGISRNSNLLIQCKNTSKDTIYIYGLQPLIEKARETQSTPLIVYSLRYTPPYVAEVKKPKFKAKRNGNNKTLEQYLKGS